MDFLGRGNSAEEMERMGVGSEKTSAGTVIPAQAEVFFLAADKERWILVKGKDGSQGYMLIEEGRIVGLDKPAEEVFSGLQFSG